ncbi:MAG: hypothetical protein JNK56_16755 [Myxococcales bacterium]|nr:hypothetical protein [Myxococcales bacterium]
MHLQLPARRDSGNTFAPLTADDVAWARDHLRLPDGHLLPALASDLRARCLAVGAPQHADVFITTLLGRLEVELGSLELDSAGQPDLVRVGSLLTIQRVSVWLKTGLQAT